MIEIELFFSSNSSKEEYIMKVMKMYTFDYKKYLEGTLNFLRF